MPSPREQGQAIARTESAIRNANCHVISSALKPSLDRNVNVNHVFLMNENEGHGGEGPLEQGNVK